MHVNVVCSNIDRTARLVNDLLQLLIFLLHGVDVAINLNKTFLEVVDLVVKDLVMLMHRHFAVN